MVLVKEVVGIWLVVNCVVVGLVKRLFKRVFGKV